MKQQIWHIREAVSADSSGLKNCMELAYSVYLDRFRDERLPPMDVDYANEIRSFPVWVAVSEEKIVGGLILTLEGECASLANIAVHPDFQGHGLGRGLMAFAESEATRRGHAELRLTTHVLLAENVSLYQHLGWLETDRDDARVYMMKSLNP